MAKTAMAKRHRPTKPADRISIFTGSLLGATAVLYATGFLISASYFGRMKIQSAGWDLVRADYIMTGVLFWALPLIVMSTGMLLLQARRRRDKGVFDHDELTPLRASLLALFLTNFYLLAMFAPPGFFDEPTGQRWLLAFLIFILALVVVIVTLIKLRERFKLSPTSRIFGRHAARLREGRNVPGVDASPDVHSNLWTDLRHIVDIVGVVGMLFFLFAFLVLLGNILLELFLFHRYPLVALASLVLIALIVVARVCKREEQDRNNPDLHQESTFPRWFGLAAIVGLLWYLAIPAYSHSIHGYVPMNRGGGDFTTAPSIVVHFRKDRIPAGDLGPFVGEGGATNRLLLIKQTSSILFVAPYGDVTDAMKWRQHDPKMYPVIWEIPKDVVALVEYLDRNPRASAATTAPMVTGP